jgi:Na+(H+)/acetate symporter ActP
VRDARRSVFWSLLFILALYLTAPAYAAFVKYEIYSHLVGSSIAQLPLWVSSWGKIGMVSIEDINGDGIVQLAELVAQPGCDPAGDARRSPACPMSSPAWSRPGRWPPRCPPPTACC